MDKHIHTLIQQSQSPDPDIRRQSLITLGKRRPCRARQEVIETLIASLDDKHLSVREAAEQGLLALKDRDVAEALIQCLSTDSPTATLNYAVEILGQIGNAAIDQILQLLESRNHNIRKFGCDILGQLKYRESVYKLIEHLNDPHVNVAIAAGEALGNIRHPEAVPYLIHALHHQDTWMRCIAAEALGKIGDPRAVDPFISMPADEDPIVLYTVIKAMGNFREQHVLPYILSALQSSPMFAPSAVQAIEHLARHLGENVYKEVRHTGLGEHFLRLLSSDNHDVLQSAVILAGQTQLQDAVHPLGQLLNHKSEDIVNDAINALAHIGEAALEEIHSLFEQNFGQCRSGTLEQEPGETLFPSANIPIIRVLGQIASPQSIVFLIRALDEGFADDIRVEAVAALAQTLSRIPDLACRLEERDGLFGSALNTLIAGLSDSSLALRICTVNALGDIGLPQAYAPLLELLKDPSLTISDAASQALTKIRGIDIEDKIESVRFLIKGADHHTLPDTVTASILRTIYRMAGETEADFLLSYLDHPSDLVTVAVLEACLNFSCSLPAFTRLVENIRPFLSADDVQVRIAALHALRHWGIEELNCGRSAEDITAQIFDDIMARLHDPHPRVQGEACRQISLLCPHLPLEQPLRKTLLTVLLSLIQTEEIMVQIAAAEAVAVLQPYIPDTHHAVPVLQRLLTQADDMQLRNALQKTLAVL
ncbi:hypothetical protein CSB45_03035 [candidate division KSB3 bacterium]|uniref:HEAT repeat domain-containing protein n=1 Tax=candidate division KSB3 bacterium TaxID=2044937 RepID=A0A2G6E9J0_9BACT|nr:MAG: hypothetical protein CSB45_03035 [candidate division KSB3 bacterium]